MSEQIAEVQINDEGQNSVKTESVNERLLKESQENKRRAQELKAQLAELENFKKAKLEEEGNYKSLLEQAKAELKAKEEESKSLKAKTLKGNIVSQISRYATDAVDLDDLLNQPRFKSIIEEGIDEDNLTLSPEKAEEYVKKVFEAKPHLRKQSAQVGTVKGGKPSYQTKEPPQVNISAMTREELNKYILSVADKGLLK